MTTPDRRFYQCNSCGWEWAHLPMRVPPHCPQCESVDTGYNKHDIRSLEPTEYPQVTVGWNEVDQTGLDVTHEQTASLFRKWLQDSNGMSWKEFAATAQPTFHMNNAITVKWCNMFLCVEEDGYCHA